MKKYVKDKKQIVDSLIKGSYKVYSCPEKVTSEKRNNYKAYVESFVDYLFESLGTGDLCKMFIENIRKWNYDMRPFGQYLFFNYISSKKDSRLLAHQMCMIEAIIDHTNINLSKKSFNDNMELLHKHYYGDIEEKGKFNE